MQEEKKKKTIWAPPSSLHSSSLLFFCSLPSINGSLLSFPPPLWPLFSPHPTDDNGPLPPPLHLHCCTRSDSEEEEEREEREAPIENDGTPPDRKASAVKGGERAPRSKSRLPSFKGGIGGSNKRGLLCPSPPPSVTPPGDERRNPSFCSPPLRSLPLHALLHIHVRIVEVCCSFDPTGKERDDGDDVRLRPPPRLHACCFREREGEKESDE